MKLPLIISMLLTGCMAQVRGQERPEYMKYRTGPDRKLVYGEVSGGYGTYFIGGAGIHYVCRPKAMITGYVLGGTRKVAGAPADYQPGAFSVPRYPQQTMLLAGAMYGWVHRIQNPEVRYLLQGGLSYGLFSTPRNFVAVQSTFWPNYSFTDHKSQAPGILLNPAIEFPFRDHPTGISLGIFSDINTVSTLWGFQLAIFFGDRRGRSAGMPAG